jgi:hypothetical protein
MRKLILGMSAMALMASAAAFAADEDDTKVAAADSSAASFTKLDADGDGRISAIEAANNSRVAAGFTTADADKDGYLSKAEYARLVKSSNGTGASSPRSSTTTPQQTVPSDSSESVPAPR